MSLQAFARETLTLANDSVNVSFTGAVYDNDGLSRASRARIQIVDLGEPTTKIYFGFTADVTSALEGHRLDEVDFVSNRILEIEGYEDIRNFRATTLGTGTASLLVTFYN